MIKAAIIFSALLSAYLVTGTTAMANSHNGSSQTNPGMSKHLMKPSKKDSKVQYKNGKASCKAPYKLFYTPPKDQFFCSLSDGPKYMSVDSNGNPHCKAPYRLIWTKDHTRLFANGLKPECTKLSNAALKKHP